jgi:protein-tyrosine phosphatase
MIDTHCHLLPGLDDGPRGEHEALALARRLVDEGVTEVLCTPHFSSMFPTRRDDAVESHRAIHARLEADGVPLRTALAAEVGPGFAASEPLEELTARVIGTRYLLVEVLPDTTAAFLPMIHERLAQAALLPIYAHPERSHAVQKSVSVLDSLRREGALVQVVAPSLIGRWGPEIRDAAWRLVDTGRADLLASDAHGDTRRRPHLREAAGLIAERLGEERVEELTQRRPAAVLGGGDA